MVIAAYFDLTNHTGVFILGGIKTPAITMVLQGCLFWEKYESLQLPWCCRCVYYGRNIDPCNHHDAAILVIPVEAAALCPNAHCARVSHFSLLFVIGCIITQ